MSILMHDAFSRYKSTAGVNHLCELYTSQIQLVQLGLSREGQNCKTTNLWIKSFAIVKIHGVSTN